MHGPRIRYVCMYKGRTLRSKYIELGVLATQLNYGLHEENLNTELIYVSATSSPAPAPPAAPPPAAPPPPPRRTPHSSSLGTSVPTCHQLKHSGEQKYDGQNLDVHMSLASLGNFDPPRYVCSGHFGPTARQTWHRWPWRLEAAPFFLDTTLRGRWSFRASLLRRVSTSPLPASSLKHGY